MVGHGPARRAVRRGLLRRALPARGRDRALLDLRLRADPPPARAGVPAVVAAAGDCTPAVPAPQARRGHRLELQLLLQPRPIRPPASAAGRSPRRRRPPRRGPSPDPVSTSPYDPAAALQCSISWLRRPDVRDPWMQDGDARRGIVAAPTSPFRRVPTCAAGRVQTDGVTGGSTHDLAVISDTLRATSEVNVITRPTSSAAARAVGEADRSRLQPHRVAQDRALSEGSSSPSAAASRVARAPARRAAAWPHRHRLLRVAAHGAVVGDQDRHVGVAVLAAADHLEQVGRGRAAPASKVSAARLASACLETTTSWVPSTSRRKRGVASRRRAAPRARRVGARELDRGGAGVQAAVLQLARRLAQLAQRVLERTSSAGGASSSSGPSAAR